MNNVCEKGKSVLECEKAFEQLYSNILKGAPNKMNDSRDAASVPGPSGFSSGSGLGFNPGAGLPGRLRILSSQTPPGRLTSLRTRDLTLGGAGALKKPKKTFEPNVHTVRKTKDELKEEVPNAWKKERKEGAKRRRVNRSKRRERPQTKTIQSHSIFEQGPADSIRKTAWRSATDLQDSPSSLVCKPGKKERKEEEEDEDEILSKLQKDDFIDEPGLRNDVNMGPIQLPLTQSCGLSRSRTPTTVTACPEHPPPPPLLPRPVVSGAGCSSSSSRRTELPQPKPPPLADMLRDLSLSGREELFFMQLPDCMPGRASSAQKAEEPALVPSPKEKPAKKERTPGVKRPPQAQEAAVKGCCPVLSQFPEGWMGKLQIRKSGKVELKLGDVLMDVSEGAAFSFLQQLVSVRLSEGRTGDMMVLGNVQHKLVLSPDFQALLRQTAPQQQHPGP